MHKAFYTIGNVKKVSEFEFPQVRSKGFALRLWHLKRH
jgi:hypothetical protein